MAVASNAHLYAFVRALSEELRRQGEKEWSSNLMNALTISSVPGEILGETRLQLHILRSSRLAIRLHLEERIDEALRYLDQVLGGRRF